MQQTQHHTHHHPGRTDGIEGLVSTPQCPWAGSTVTRKLSWAVHVASSGPCGHTAASTPFQAPFKRHHSCPRSGPEPSLEWHHTAVDALFSSDATPSMSLTVIQRHLLLSAGAWESLVVCFSKDQSLMGNKQDFCHNPPMRTEVSREAHTPPPHQRGNKPAAVGTLCCLARSLTTT
jgi:hypothetical protein